MEDIKGLIQERIDKIEEKESERLKGSGIYQKRAREIEPWQQLAIEICEEFNVKQDKGLIFKVCKNYNPAFIRHCFEETKELARGEKASHYFIKLVYCK